MVQPEDRVEGGDGRIAHVSADLAVGRTAAAVVVDTVVYGLKAVGDGRSVAAQTGSAEVVPGFGTR